MSIQEDLKAQIVNCSNPSELTRTLFQFMEEHGNTNYDESVTQLQHALQCAGLAKTDALGDAAITAALFHDIGHLLVNEHDGQSEFLQQDMNHEEAGAKFLSEWFPLAVTEPIRLHVAAKRYLCSTDTTYYERLSDSSKRSFELQGGGFSAGELQEIERNEYLEIAVQLRRFDDLAKVAGKPVSPIENFTQCVIHCLQ